MSNKLKLPINIPEGHGSSFKKGIAEALLESAKTDLTHTPEGHNKSRELGKKFGKELADEIKKIVKPI